MNILIFGANWYNHGDESAVRAMIDEFKLALPEATIRIQFNQTVKKIPYSDIEIVPGFRMHGGRNKLKNIPYIISLKTNGSVNLGGTSKGIKEFIEALKWADYAIYAPGGPSIGDYYKQYYLVDMMLLMRKYKVPYSIFAPSMGPFSEKSQKISDALRGANVVCFREKTTQGYVKKLLPEKETVVTLDSAFQHEIDYAVNEEKLLKYEELKHFFDKNEKIVGITVRELGSRRNFKGVDIDSQINNSFVPFVKELESRGYGILFIPQLFGIDNDADFMKQFSGENSFVMNEKEDCYFQQFVISKLYACVGMRYHSNIFSAKMGTPFISVAYEHKMSGFMEKAGLEQFCVEAKELSKELLIEKFDNLESTYQKYRDLLAVKRKEFMADSSRTTKLIVEDIKKCCA